MSGMLCFFPPHFSHFVLTLHRYRHLALKFHPSRETGCSEKFSQLGEAYDVLSDRK